MEDNQESNGGREMKCSCKDWEKNIGYIDGGIIINYMHGVKTPDSAKFRYCPWCGKSLKHNARIVYKNTLINPKGETKP